MHHFVIESNVSWGNIKDLCMTSVFGDKYTYSTIFSPEHSITHYTYWEIVFHCKETSTQRKHRAFYSPISLWCANKHKSPKPADIAIDVNNLTIYTMKQKQLLWFK